MTFYRYGRATGWSLAASLALHGIAVGGLVLSVESWSPDLSRGSEARGAASGGPVVLHLLRESAARDQAGASAEVPLPRAPTRRVQPPPAPARRAASEEKPEPRAPLPPPAPLRSEDPPEVASEPASPPQPLTPPATDAEGAPSQTVIGMASGASGPAGWPLPSVNLGPGGGYETGRVDRVARPVGSIRPHYPPRARQRGEEADVVVAVWVGAQGDVDRVAVSRSAGTEFDAAALTAVQKARFSPALRDGRQVPSRVALRVHFRLEE